MTNLDAIRALQAEQEGAAEAAAPEPRRSGRKAPQAATRGSDQGDADIKTMLAEVDLLSVVQADAGEQGHRSANYIRFAGECPVCGHSDCFRYYPDTNSWSCFGGSNTTGYDGGSALEYFKATRTDDDTEAVKWLRGETGHPYEPKTKDGHRDGHRDGHNAKDGEQDGDALILPPWVRIRATEPPKRNGVLIDGLLRRGHVALLAAKGKAGKSWSAIQLSIAVATGGEWFGCKCEQGEVLYIDPEIDRKSLDNRFAEVCKALGADAAEIDKHVSKWPLRGVEGATMGNIVHDLDLLCTFGCFALVVIDSCSVFVEGDENSSVDIRRFSAKVLRVAAITGASVLLIQHYGKGSAGDRDAADRARGSSVWLDFPDATLFLTETFPPSGAAGDYLQDGERAFLLETGGLREFPAIEPKRLIYSYPTHRVDAEGITEGWKPKSGQQTGGRKTAEANKAKALARAREAEAALSGYFIREGIGADGVPITEAAELCGTDTKRLKGWLMDAGTLDGKGVFRVWEKSKRKHLVVPNRPPMEQRGMQGAGESGDG